MKKRNFAYFLSDKTGVNTSEYNKLFNSIESKYGVSINDYIQDIPDSALDSKVFPYMNSSYQPTEVDKKLADEFDVSARTIASIRLYDTLLDNVEAVRTEQKQIDLHEINDSQRLLLSQLAYLDITDEGVEKIKNGGLKVSELSDYLKNENSQFVGNIVVATGVSKVITDVLAGKDTIISDKQLLNDTLDAGLGDLTITNIINDKNSGLQAMAFKDESGNTGISYRGTDFDYNRGAISDIILTDVGEYLSDDSMQRKQALKFFEQNADANGNNFLYGHSLGGNLTSHVFLNHYDEIREAFTINGTPLRENMLNTDEKIAAFNSDKYNCNIVAGDVVAHLKDFSKYENNVHYIENNGNTSNNSFIYSHIVQSAAVDENGKFVETTKEGAFEQMNKGERNFVAASQAVNTFVKDVVEDFKESKVGKWLIGIGDSIKDTLEDIKDNVKEHLDFGIDD